MRQVSCAGGFTQISKVLSHARRESAAAKVNALIYVGDCMEEDVDRLAALAGELGMIGTPVFVFQEGRDSKAERAFREIARLSRGAYAPFDAGSAQAAARAAHRCRGLCRGRAQSAERFQRGDEERRSLASPRAARLTGYPCRIFWPVARF